MTSCRTLYSLLSVVALLGAAAASPADEPLTLIADGRPASCIVLPDDVDAKSLERQAAGILVEYFRRMSGAVVEIIPLRDLGTVSVDDGRVVVGSSGASAGERNYILLGETELTRKLGVDDEGLGPGGLRIRSRKNAVVLLGGPRVVAGEPGEDAAGIRHAVLELLERLGCRFLRPGPFGEVVPGRRTVKVGPLDVSFTPSIRRRHLRPGSSPAGNDFSDRGLRGLEHLGLSVEQIKEWRQRRNADAVVAEKGAVTWSAWQRLGGVMSAYGHAGSGLRDGEHHMKTHPEWFALQADGTRDQGGDDRWRLCKSNQELIAYIAADIIGRIEPGTSPLISIDPNDGGSNTGHCLCAHCEALDPPDAPKISLMTFGSRAAPDRPARERMSIEHASLSDRMLTYWNEIARRVTAVHPNARLGVSVYAGWQQPPVREKLHPNLVVRYVPSTIDHLAGWRKAGMRTVYWRPNVLLVNRRHGKLTSIITPLAATMREFAAAGIIQTDFDSITGNWMTLGPTYYAAARLNWNPHLSAEEIIDDYAKHGFGAAAEPIGRYLQRIEALTAQGIAASHVSADDYRYRPSTIAELRELLTAADRAAGDNAEIHERIAFLRRGLNYTELQETLDDLARRAAETDSDIDRKRARLLLDLNCLLFADTLVSHPDTLNAASIAWGTGGFAKWRSLARTPSRPSDASLLERVAEPKYGLTGRENSLYEMLAAFGLEE